jgi:DNA-binding CsgD family transcriptional regulator
LLLKKQRPCRCIQTAIQPFADADFMNESDLIDQIYSTITDPGRWPEVIVMISDHLGAIGGLLNQIGPDSHVLSVNGRLADEYVRIYERQYVWNPWSLAMRDHPFDQAVILNKLVPRGNLVKTGFYADVLVPLGIENNLATRHKALGYDGGLGGFGFMLSPRASEQAEHALSRLQRLSPHLGRALDATMEVSRIAGGSQKLAAILHAMPNPALLLDRNGRIVHANPAAEALLTAADGLTFDRNGRLQLAAILPAETGAVTRALALALDVATGAGTELSEPVRITRPSGAGPLLLLPVPLPPPAFQLWELSDVARVMVLIIDPSSQRNGVGAALRKTFGLTAAEARVVTLVGSGLSGPQTAQVLGVSPATVKTHLTHSFDKIGVRSQLELVRILSALPADRPLA